MRCEGGNDDEKVDEDDVNGDDDHDMMQIMMIMNLEIVSLLKDQQLTTSLV